VSILGNWTNKGPMMTRPKWSDEAGQVQLVAFACRFIIDFVSLFTLLCKRFLHNFYSFTDM